MTTEPVIVNSPLMEALISFQKEPTAQMAAGIELEIRKLIMGGISHVEAVRAQLMAGQFEPFGVPSSPGGSGAPGSSGPMVDPTLGETGPTGILPQEDPNNGL